MKDLLEAFEKHDILNPKIWDENNEMLPEVSEKINEIVDYFMDSLSIKMSPIDVHIVGSNASYNYTSKSDLDVHVVVNFESIDAPKEIVMALLNDEKASFNKSHGISIHGVDVEMYVEDVKSTTVSNGIYSLYEEKWIKFPVKIDNVPQVDVTDAKDKWVTIAQNLLNTGTSEEISGAIDTLYMIRKNSIDVDGEFGKGNILFKELRNDGVLQELKDALVSTKSKELSLESYRQKYSNKLLEDTRKELISKSKHADNYVPWNQHKGRNRYQRRTKSRVANSVREFNSIDMNNLFKMGILTVNINVHGETDNYLVRISFGGFNEILRDFIEKNNGNLDLRCIIRTLAIGFERDDIYIHCSCPDWCLHGDTRIKLLNGETISVAEMLDRHSKGEELWVYSTDGNGDFKPGKVSDVWISGYTDDMIEVTLDNGEKIITTPNHRYMLRDGSYLEAENLSVGQSLMPLYFKKNINGYEDVKKNSVVYPTQFNSVYKEVANTVLKDKIEEAKKRSNEDVIAIHHADFNKLNNYPSNLVPMGKNEHWKYHYDNVKESGRLDKFLAAGKKYWETEEAKNKQADVCRKVLNKYYKNRTPEQEKSDFIKHSDAIKNSWKNGCFNTEKFKNASILRGKLLQTEKIQELAKNGIREYWDNISEDDKNKRTVIAIKNLEKAHLVVKSVKKSESHKRHLSESRRNRSSELEIERNKKITESKILKVLNECILMGLPITNENYEFVRKSRFVCGYPKIERRFDSIDSAVSFYGLNHKIKEIRRVHYDEQIPVYDISVDEYNNFYVDAGVVLHNCYRFDYWAHKHGTASTANPDDPLDRPAKITNPHDTKGAGCKHVLLCLNNNAWLIKVASVIWNYINYMKEYREKLYADIIYPAIYGKPYEDDVQTSMFDEEPIADDTDTSDVDVANEYGRKRTQFKQGNKQGIRFAPEEDRNQQSFEEIEEEQ